MPRIFRSMTNDNGKPLVANTARGLGVRFGDGPHDDIPIDADGNVHSGKGMSVVPAWRLLKFHRIPRRLRSKVPQATGKPEDACWRMGEGPFSDGPVAMHLTLITESSEHGVVSPDAAIPSVTFVEALVATRDSWVVDED
jgi:hypothetical protein